LILCALMNLTISALSINLSVSMLFRIPARLEHAHLKKNHLASSHFGSINTKFLKMAVRLP
jgi:hypothetical protein